MTIAICMATFNGSDYLSEQIDSIINQSYSDWLLYIHDDNSTDETISIIRAYVKRYPEKICYFDDDISYSNPSLNFSSIVTRIPGNVEYIMFSDQDDFWLENKVLTAINKIRYVEENNPRNLPVLVHCDLIIVDKDKNED